MIAEIYTDNKLFIACQGIPASLNCCTGEGMPQLKSVYYLYGSPLPQSRPRPKLQPNQPPQEPPQQPQQLHTHTPPEPAVTSVEQGPRQRPRYTCQGVPTCGITVLNPGEDLSQLINKLQPSITIWEKEHPSQRVYTTLFIDRRYHN